MEANPAHQHLSRRQSSTTTTTTTTTTRKPLSRKRPLSTKLVPSGHKYRYDDNRPEELPHPFRLFPRPHDRITSLWVAKKTRHTLSDYERVYPWVMEGEGEQQAARHMGILEAPSPLNNDSGSRSTTRLKAVGAVVRDKQSRARRAWRELMRQDLTKAHPPGVPARDKVVKDNNQVQGQQGGYIMVRADVLQEDLQLERKLRTDRASLKEQCTWYFTDSTMSTREALPLVKLAVDEVCEREMAEAALAYQTLSRWKPHRANPHLIKPPLPRVVREEEGEEEEDPVMAPNNQDKLTVQARVLCRVGRMPVRDRFGYVQDLMAQIERQVMEREMELMAHEERLGRQAWKYVEALERKKDYELYYTLAHIFGVLSQELFDRTCRPGNFYYKALSRSAGTMQCMWRRYWPGRKKRKFKAARAMQTIWRAFMVRKSWTPIVKLRVKCGYRAQVRYRFKRWFKVVRAIVGVREGFKRATERHVRNHFQAWAQYVVEEMRTKKEQGNRLMLRINRRYNKQLFFAWRRFSEHSIHVKTNFRRVMHNPYFKWWADYVDLIKRQKKEIKLALICQALGRGMSARRKMRAYRGHLSLVRRNVQRLHCMKQYRRLLRAKYDTMVLDYVASKQDKLVQPLIAKETARLDGLKKEQAVVERQGEHSKWLKEDDLRRALVAVKHNYEATNLPPFRSPDPHHIGTFVLPEHLEQQHPDWAPLYLLLTDVDKVVGFCNWVGRVHGTTDLLWTLNFWRAVEGLRSLTTTSDAFFMKRLKLRMLQIVDRYLSPSPVNPTRVSPSVAHQATTAANNLRHLSSFAWGTQRLAAYGGVLEALYAAQFEAFVSLHDGAVEQFWQAEVGRDHLTLVKSQRVARWKKDEEEMLARHRNELLSFARDVRKELKQRRRYLEEAIVNQAETVMGLVVDRVVEMVVGEACATYAINFNTLIDEVFVDTVNGVEDAVTEGMVRQAAEMVIEETFLDEYAAMIVDDLLLHIITQEMLVQSTDTVHEQMERETEDKANAAVQRVDDAMANQLIQEVIREINQVKAVVMIQCFLRTRLAVKRCRALVARHLVKVWDPTYERYYWYNDLNSTSSWDKPAIIDKLFHAPALTNGQQRVSFSQTQMVEQW